jgi:hypothetical protein
MTTQEERRLLTIDANAAVNVFDPFSDSARHRRMPCFSANCLKKMSMS